MRNVVLNQLYKHTQLQDTFGVIMLALVNNQPKVMNLLEMLTYYLQHQEEVVTRRTKYDLNKAQERSHILEGLLKALDHIDEVIHIIRASANAAEAKKNLMERFDLSGCPGPGNRRHASARSDRSGTGRSSRTSTKS